MSDDEYCPALPPGLMKKKIDDKVCGPQLPPHHRASDKEKSVGLVLPPHLRKDKDLEINVIGPAMPPGFKTNDSVSDSSEDDSIGPMLPPHLRKDKETESNVIGPAMPPGFKTNDSASDSSEDESIGPMLPPHLRKDKETESNVIGPAMPPGFKTNYTESSEDSIGPKLPPNFKTNIGPQLPPQMTSQCIGPLPPRGDMKVTYSSEEEDNDVIGPMPSEMLKGDNTHVTAAEIEARAAQMRNRLEGKEEKEEVLSRESWMTELPSNKLSQNIGLQARSFRAKAAPDMTDRSAWTDTPSDREKKQQKEEDGRKRPHGDVGQSSRDKQLEKDVKKYNKSNRPESLLEMHQKEIQKKKKKTEDQPKERRPFDREQDLQVNRFDDAQRKAIIKKSQKLDSRFSHGGTHFL